MTAEENKIIILRTKNELFGVEALNIVELTRIVNFEPLEVDGEPIQGYLYYREETLPLIDAGFLLEFDHGPFDIDSKIAIIKGDNSQSVGLLIDDLEDIINQQDCELARVKPNKTQLYFIKYKNHLVPIISPVEVCKMITHKLQIH